MFSADLQQITNGNLTQFSNDVVYRAASCDTSASSAPMKPINCDLIDLSQSVGEICRRSKIFILAGPSFSGGNCFLSSPITFHSKTVYLTRPI